MIREHLDARDPLAAPQAIPAGYRGLHDWADITDAEAALRGLPVYTRTPHDRHYDRETFAFTEGADGAWSYTTTLVPGDRATALGEARRALSERRYAAEVGGMVVEGFAYPFKTDRAVSQPEIRAKKVEALAHPDYTVANFEVVRGVFLTLTNADLVALGSRLDAHVQACRDRAAAIDAELVKAADAWGVRDALAAAIETGWPANTPGATAAAT